MTHQDLRLRARLATAFFVLADLLIVYVAFMAALKIRLGTWHWTPIGTGLGVAIAISVVTYLGALWLSGLYDSRPETLRVEIFLRVGTFMFVAWAVSLAVTYLATPTAVPARTVTAAQCIFSLVGVLGLRASLRYLSDRRNAPHSRRAPVVRPENLLDRKPIELDAAEIRNHLSGRTVLVTGAGGSIGNELCRMLLDLNPFRLIMVDVSEYNLFQLEKAVRGTPFAGELEFRIADVRDESIMNSIFASFHPDVVFHAAAYKHVPLMERHPVEAFTNNTMSTVGLARLSEAYGAEQFIFVSTDKAVAPTSVLGATKRLAEWYVRAVNGPMVCKTVRFGNVLASQGSVVPLFLEQIESGGPVTVTHPDMTRFFMTAAEAATLILQTLLLDRSPVYTIAMGEALPIRVLAERMIAAYAPAGSRPRIEYTGIRPGEKLTEQLWGEGEAPMPSGHPGIIGLQSAAPYSRAELDEYFRFLGTLCAENRAAELRKALFQTKLYSESESEGLGLRNAV